MRPRHRRPRTRHMRQHRRQRFGGQDLETLQRLGRRLEPAQQRQRRLRIARRRPGGRTCGGQRHQPQCRCGDDPQRPFRTDQQLRQVVTPIVLLQCGKPVMHAAVRQHRLDARDQPAHRPEAQHLRAARIGRDEAPDGRIALRPQRQRKAPPLRKRRIVQVGQDHPRLGDGEPRRRIDAPHPVHPAQRQDQRRSVGGRRRPADHRTVAPLRHQRHPMPRRRGDHRRDLGGRGRCEQRRRGAAKPLPPVHRPRRDIGGIGHDTLRPQHRGEIGKQCGLGGSHARPLPPDAPPLNHVRPLPAVAADDSKFILRSTIAARSRHRTCRPLRFPPR